jgi:hypothetical protein
MTAGLGDHKSDQVSNIQLPAKEKSEIANRTEQQV